ncbi:UTRA domain-containing protein [Sporolactobacillus terrae]|uniref:Putative HTH-type transcriptional regulator YurK n=1 Tax=Sporolactobacillus terrae TaxID=269673 RepID=A0A410D6B8_9BACL|nr:UTRA domain-containing protein [Sporolactobacillus terrae]QAA21645.1 UTRA domain-containing protein [Sporolactobacillus terrae]QAA24617.1 UTRA domain-containing protein [Sporolactobacillus terrae]UAK16454.1 UTRA domain-containing protein [Sporolactobacillus terrae]BBN97907.1 putative HTH-type transcriptional regulator YurK [Sporolactobacillus terrae]
MLNKDNLYPLYIQVKRKIIEEIHNDTYTEGSRLPSETELCEKYAVSRITIRRSLQDMVESGYLVRKQGKGTFVKRGKIKRSLISPDGYTEYMKETGQKPERKIVEKMIKPCSPFIAKRLAIPPESEILELCRILYIKDVPLGYEVNSYPISRFHGLEAYIDDHVSTHEVLQEKYGVTLKSTYKVLNVLLANEKNANYLNCNVSTPVYQLDKTAFNQYNTAIYHSLMYYDVNRVSFVIEDQKDE